MNPLQHLNLLLRHDRSLNLRTALIEAVDPGSRVLDAGCGVGLLSLWATQAGASTVLAIDLEAIDIAEALTEENGFGHAVQFMKADLWSLDMPNYRNAFDVIAAMIYLNDPRRDERQSELAYSLRDRYLAPGGKMIPDKVRYLARACDWPAQDHPTRQSRLVEHIRDLEGRYGLSFNALAKKLASAPWHAFFPSKDGAGRLHLDGARMLSRSTIFAEIDYSTPGCSYPDAFQITANAPGVFNSLIWTQELWFEDRLLFANESVSWIDVPRAVGIDTKCTVRFGNQWRRLNLATIIDATEGSREAHI